MLKPTLLLNFVIMLLLAAEFSHAHAVITQSSLSIAPIAASQSTPVSLQFNSRIELGLSRIFLVRTGDKLTPLNISQGKKPGEVVIDMPALETGEYAIKLKVFAADGHLTEDILHFTVRP
jgi:methionine-rich copper-binding protein CopC